MKKLSVLLTIVVVLESVVLVGLILARSRVVISRISTGNDPAAVDPLLKALEYEAPDATFERLVKQNPRWIPFRFEKTSNTVLGVCAEMKRTNLIQMLIENGANVADAVDDEKKKNNADAALLLQQIQSEPRR